MNDIEQYRQISASADSGFASYFLLLLGLACVSYIGLGRLRSLPALFLPDLTAKMPKIRALRPFTGLGGALLVGLLLRLPQMFDPMWFDETFTAALARLDLARLFTVIMADVHPPTNYLISWAVVRVLGDSEAALRLPALLSGVLLIYFTWRLSVRLFPNNRKVALLAAWLVAVMPSAIRYANEARQYSLLACLVFALLICAVEKRRVAFVLVGVLTAWTHNLGFVYLVVIGLALLLIYRRAWLKPVVISWAASALWLPALLHQAAEVGDGFWLNFTLPGALLPLFSMTLTNSIPVDWAMFATASFLPVLGLSLLWAVPWILSKRGLLWLAVFAGVPLVAALVSLWWTPIYLHRALLPSVLLAVPVLAQFLMENRRARWLWRGLAGAGLALSVVGFFIPGQGRTTEGRDIAQFCAGADVIYNTGLTTQFIASYYAPEIASYLAPTAQTDQGMRLDDSALDALGFQVVGNPLPLGTDICALVIHSPFNEGPEWIKQFLEPGSFLMTNRIYTNYYNIDFYRIFVS